MYLPFKIVRPFGRLKDPFQSYIVAVQKSVNNETS